MPHTREDGASGIHEPAERGLPLNKFEHCKPGVICWFSAWREGAWRRDLGVIQKKDEAQKTVEVQSLNDFELYYEKYNDNGSYRPLPESKYGVPVKANVDLLHEHFRRMKESDSIPDMSKITPLTRTIVEKVVMFVKPEQK